MIKILIISILAFNVAFSESNFSGERLQQAIDKWIDEQIHREYSLEYLQKISDLTFTQSNVEAEINADSRALKGISSINLDFYHDGKLIKRYPVSLKIRLYDMMPVAVKTIRSGETITKDIVAIQKIDITNIDDSQIIELKDMDGMSACRTISKGLPILKDNLQGSKLIKKGDLVEILVYSGSILIRTTGKAMGDGIVGEKMAIQREGSVGTLYGTLDESGKVIIKD